MKWDAERWRKLYRRADGAWLLLPLLARGLGSELLKYADDDGRIPTMADETTGEAMCRIMSAHKSERKLVADLAEKLVADGYITREPGAIVIRNFVRAQARSTGAERQARLRERRKQACGAVDDAEDVTDTASHGDVTSNGQRNAGVTVTDPSQSHGSRSLSLSSSDASGSLSADQKKEVPDTAHARDSETRAKAGEQPTLPGLGVPKATQRRKPKPAEHPMPADWQPTEAHRAYAAQHGVDLGVEVFGFRGWAEGRTQVSWNGAFATRLANAVKWAKERASGGGQRPVQYGRGAPAPDRRQPGGMASGTDPGWENFQE